MMYRDLKKDIFFNIVQKKVHLRHIFEEAQLLRIPSFVNASKIYVIEGKQIAFVITNICSWGPNIHGCSESSMKLVKKWT